MLLKPNLDDIKVARREREVTLHMSYDQFHEWAHDMHAEWVDGKVTIFRMATRTHQTILYFLSRLIGLYLDTNDAGVLLFAPYEMHIASHRAYREPDLMFIKAEREHLVTNDRMIGAADLVVEIVSPDSLKRDQREKFDEYEAAGVQEYWVIDSRVGRHEAQFYTLQENGRYFQFASEQSERVDSRVLPGFWFPPDWLWDSQNLNPIYCFARMRGIDPAIFDALFDRGNEEIMNDEL